MIKILRLALAAGVSWLAMTAQAAADPFSIGAFLLGNLVAVGGPALAISPTLVGNIVLGALAIGANVAVGLAGRQKIKPQEYKNQFETGEGSEIRAVGRVRIGGMVAFGNTKGLNRYRLICHSRGRVSAVEEHFLGGREITVDPDGRVSSPPWVYPNGSFAKVEAKVGDGTETAWAALVTDFPLLWTSAHRVRGIAHSLVTFVSPGLTSEKFLKLYQQGEPPYDRVERAEPIYDPRIGGHGIDTESTWTWGDNGPLVAAHILRSYPNFSSGDFDWDAIEDAADLADVLVATKTGTEKRSRCWGIWPSESPRGDVMQQVLESIGAEIVPGANDKISIRLINDAPTPEIAFTAKHIVDIQRRYGPEGVERPNLCIVKYYSPERNFDMAEINMSGIAWARVQDEIDRYGEKPMTVELPFCPSASQAQRIARRQFALARADVGVATLNMAGLAAWGLSYASFEFPDLNNGASIFETCAIGSPRCNDAEGTVEIPFVIWPTLAVWNPAVHEAAAPDPIPELQYESNLDKPAMPSAATVVQYPSTAYESRVAYAPVAGATIAEANYRTYTGGEPNAWAAMTEVGLTLAYVAVNLVGNEADFRVRFFNAAEEGSYLSDVRNVPSMAISNTVTSAPVQGVTGSNGDWTVTVTAPSNLNVAYVIVQKKIGAGAWTNHHQANARPGTVVVTDITDALGAGQTIEIRSYAYTSNGTQSAASATFSFTEPL